MITEIPGWILGAKELSKEFTCADFRDVMGFTNRIARLADVQQHHPELLVSYKKCRVTLSTHKVGGLSRNDFILAAKIDAVEQDERAAWQPGIVGTSLRGMTLLVTGASQRIGREIALSLADEGANIVAHYRSSRRDVETLCEEVRKRGGEGWPLQADFPDIADAEKVVVRAQGQAGKLDGIINSAAAFSGTTLGKVDFLDISENMRVNAWAPFVLGREFFRAGNTGSIVNILDSRIAGYDWLHVGYAMSKQALAHLTAMMALSLPRTSG